VLAVLFLPVLLAALSAVLGLGHIMHLRQVAYQAADLGALAGVQCLDLDELAAGRLQLLPAEAAAQAADYARLNLAVVSVSPADVAVDVSVLNPAGDSLTDPVTGKGHPYSTVCVTVSFPSLFRFGPVSWTQVIRAHADASVVPR
jgi:hypothetical protein